MAEPEKSNLTPTLTPTEVAARTALTSCDEALRVAQDFLTKALPVLAQLESERHPHGPRITAAISESRSLVKDVQRKVKTLLVYSLPREGFQPAGTRPEAEEFQEEMAVAMGQVAGLNSQRGLQRIRYDGPEIPLAR